MAKTFDDFKKAHDPMFVGDSPIPIWDWQPPKGVKRFIFTAAQNATPVHKSWWAILNGIAESLNAELRVLPIRYKNPTSAWIGSQKNAEHWVEEVHPYLVNTRVQINPNLQLLADIKIQPTAADPVGAGDLAAISGPYSAIIGHTKIQTKVIPTPQSKTPKLLMTSGACTIENYSDSRAGRVGAFHHSLSAVLVEVDGNRFYARRLHYDAKTDSCTDHAAGIRYEAEGNPAPAPRALALVTGDLHCDYADPRVVEATFGDGGMVDVCRPQNIVYHDIIDGYAVNPHHEGNPLVRIAKHFSGADCARSEVERMLQFLREKTRKDTQNIIVASNHDDFLTRWIKRADWKQDPANADFYLEVARKVVQGTRLTSQGTRYPAAFKMLVDEAKLPNTRALDLDESFALGGVELGMHGHLGPNGARGSIRNLRRIGIKSIIAHSHKPGEDEGATQVGTSTWLRQEYNPGPSSWLNAHAILGADSKRQLVVIIDGYWRL